MTSKALNYFSIFVSTIGIVPLAILGLLTPYQFVAFLLGLSDVSPVLFAVMTAYDEKFSELLCGAPFTG